MDASSGSYPSIEVLRDAPARGLDVADWRKETVCADMSMALFTPPPMLFAPLKTSTPKFHTVAAAKGAVKEGEGGRKSGRGAICTKTTGGEAVKKGEGGKGGVASNNKEIRTMQEISSRELEKSGVESTSEKRIETDKKNVDPNRMGNRVGRGKVETRRVGREEGKKGDNNHGRAKLTKKCAKAKKMKDDSGRDMQTGKENQQVTKSKSDGRSGGFENGCSRRNRTKLMTSPRMNLHPLQERQTNLHYDSTESTLMKSTLMNQLMDFDVSEC